MTHWPDIAGRLEGNSHVLPIRVYYEDTDFTGIVYHANFLKFLERGRSDYLRLLGIHHNALQSVDGLVFAVRHMEIDFIRPAQIDDLLIIETTTASARGARIILNQRALLNDQVLLSAKVTIAIITPSGKPRRLPSDIQTKLDGQRLTKNEDEEAT